MFLKLASRKLKKKTIRKVARIFNAFKLSIIEVSIFQSMRIKQKIKNRSRSFLVILLIKLKVFLKNNNKLLNITIIDIVFYTKLINKKS